MVSTKERCQCKGWLSCTWQDTFTNSTHHRYQVRDSMISVQMINQQTSCSTHLNHLNSDPIKRRSKTKETKGSNNWKKTKTYQNQLANPIKTSKYIKTVKYITAANYIHTHYLKNHQIINLYIVGHQTPFPAPVQLGIFVLGNPLVIELSPNVLWMNLLKK